MREVTVLSESTSRGKIIILERLDRGGEFMEPKYSLKICRRFKDPEKAQAAFNREAYPRRRKRVDSVPESPK